MTTSRHVFRFSKFSSRHWSLALSCCSSVVWSPAATHWCWWSWRGTSQQGQSGRWDDERFVVSLDFQIPSDFVSFNFGGGWLTGWDARHTQGTTWQTHGLSRGSALVWGFSSEGRVTEDWRSSTLVSSTVLTPLEKGQEEVEFLFFKNSILRFLSLFMAEGLFLLLNGRGSGILSPFSRETEKVPNETLIE